MTITDEMVERAAKAIGAIESKTNGYVELYPEPLRNKISAPLLDKIARTALHEQAQEIERLNVQVSLRHNAYLEGTARIAELEAERDAAHGLARTYLAWSHKAEAERDEAKDDYLRRHKDVGDQMDRRIKAEAERDAIRAKTFEECLAEIIAAPDREEAIENIRALAQTDEVTSLQDADPELQDAVIALAQTDEGKTETGE